MHPKDMLHKALTAASVAEAEGFPGMAGAFLDLASGINGLTSSPSWSDILPRAERVPETEKLHQ
jgi:hypothetical protein